MPEKEEDAGKGNEKEGSGGEGPAKEEEKAPGEKEGSKPEGGGGEAAAGGGGKYTSFWSLLGKQEFCENDITRAFFCFLKLCMKCQPTQSEGLYQASHFLMTHQYPPFSSFSSLKIKIRSMWCK